MKLLYVVNEARFFLSHRLPLALEARSRGYDVVVATAPDTGEERVLELGLQHRAIKLTRSGFNLGAEISSYRSLKRLYQEEKPDLVHHVTIKPVLYGSFAARASGIKAVVNAVPGMGYVFTRRGTRASIGRAGVNFLYRLALQHENMRVIFQNREDLAGFIAHAIVRREQTVLIRGSGVDLDRYCRSPEPDTAPTFLLASRMLKDKGVVEFAQAAGAIKAGGHHQDWNFRLAGGVDAGNPGSLTEVELRRLEADYGVEWLGHRDDVEELLRGCHVLCLPSYYREGVPKVLLEGSAVSRAMIASDIAGCREVITDEVTGLIVAPHDVASLAAAMIRLGADAALRQRLGEAAYDKAVAVFSEQDIVAHTFRVYEELCPVAEQSE
ncbi:MAG: glycosyltransferase family 4 protein [Pseudomonadales bacterium]|nr:glycosyltransferase family 4 protein [Pseudomonadales bacterium]